MFAQADAVQICGNIRSTRYIEWVCNRLCNVYKNTIKIILNIYWREKDPDPDTLVIPGVGFL